MSKALLVGNGFTSQLIPAYQNEQAMQLLAKFEPNIVNKANYLFTQLKPHIPFFSGSIPELSPKERVHIDQLLQDYGIRDSQYRIDRILIGAGLIFEFKNDSISSVESMLKMVALLDTQFPEGANNCLKLTANKIYFNNGNNGLACLSPEIQQSISRWIDGYDLIFTTNYDCILDDVYSVPQKIMHLHGGFHFSDRHHYSADILLPEQAYLIWGIDGEDKTEQTKGGPVITADGKVFILPDHRRLIVQSVVGEYRNILASDPFDSIDIFGYSGENDQHINTAIAENDNIRNIRYFCDPRDKDSSPKLNHIRSLFTASNAASRVNVELVSWDEIWDQIKNTTS